MRHIILRMKVLHVIALLGFPTIGISQWVHYPTAGVPKKADGTYNLAAPPPRLPDGKPDFSGIWHTARIIPCSPDLNRFINCGSEIGGSPLALDFGVDMPGGLPYQPWAAALVKQRKAAQGVDDPHVRCLPDNPPRTWVMPHLTKAVHTPKLLVLLYEVNAMYRQIFIDGRPLPQDPNPGWTGYSTARWEGDTLVVQTAGFRDDLWADMSGSPLSGAAKLTERIRRPNYGTLELEVTVDDPRVYTKPWTVKLTQKPELDTELIDEVCLENEKSYERMRAVQPSSRAGVTGRWSAGGDSVFVLRQAGEAVTGEIQGRPGEPVYKIVDGVARGNQIRFFVLHEDANDPEVKANGGNPFHNIATGTFNENEIDISGSRENTKIREYHMLLKRISDK
jgi:hypothetical protein